MIQIIEIMVSKKAPTPGISSLWFNSLWIEPLLLIHMIMSKRARVAWGIHVLVTGIPGLLNRQTLLMYT